MVLLVAASLLAAVEPVKLASPGLAGVQISSELAAYYSDHLSQLLEVRGTEVVTPSQILAMIGIDRQKQLLGCAEGEASCMAELANALGVDGIVTGSLGNFGGLYQLNLTVVAASDGRKLAVYSATANNEDQVLLMLQNAAASIAEQAAIALDRSPHSARWWSWVPAAAGLVGVGLGAAMFSLASARARSLRGSDGMPSLLAPGEADATLSTGVTERTAGIVAFSIGGAALLAAGALWLFGAPAPIMVAPAPGGGGGGWGLVFSGALP